MKTHDIAVTPSESTIVLKPTNGSTFVANMDGSIGVHRESIPLLIRVLAEQLTEHHVASVGEQSLRFVVAVEFIAPGPRSRLNGLPRGWRRTGG